MKKHKASTSGEPQKRYKWSILSNRVTKGWLIFSRPPWVLSDLYNYKLLGRSTWFPLARRGHQLGTQAITYSNVVVSTLPRRTFPGYGSRSCWCNPNTNLNINKSTINNTSFINLFLHFYFNNPYTFLHHPHFLVFESFKCFFMFKYNQINIHKVF